MKKFLLAIFLLIMAQAQASAVLSDEQVMSPKYIINHGHSKEMARLIDLQSSQINGQKPKYDRNEPEWYTSNKTVSFFRKWFMIADPALDDQQFMQHDTNFSSNVHDL